MDDQNVQVVFARWVQPLYLSIGNAGYLHLKGEGRTEFEVQVKRTIRTVDENTMRLMFEAEGWRGPLTAAWLCGIKEWRHYTGIIGQRLSDSFFHSAHGCCFALACFGDEQSADHLIRCVMEPNSDTRKHPWAFAALRWIDEREGTTHLRTHFPILPSPNDPVAKEDEFGQECAAAWKTMRQAMGYCRNTFGLGS